MSKTPTQDVLKLSHQDGCGCGNCGVKRILNGLPEKYADEFGKAALSASQHGVAFDEIGAATALRSRFEIEAARTDKVEKAKQATANMTMDKVHASHSGLTREELKHNGYDPDAASRKSLKDYLPRNLGFGNRKQGL